MDQSALIAALQTGNLGGAALDLISEEPLPQESSLLNLENVIVHLIWLVDLPSLLVNEWILSSRITNQLNAGI